MDADWLVSQRDQFLSQREKRWSMNSQRLEEIVAELMKPISSDGRRSFDTDLSALLEEYLTEAGLRALDTEVEAGPGPGAGAAGGPNFAEIALLLQHSADIYGRKVDFLYRHVLSVSEALLNTTQEIENSSSAAPEEPQTPSAARRARRSSERHEDFCEIALEACAGAARAPDAPRPPPTLPRLYLELEPRAPAPADVPLLDYCAESIGLLADFQLTWRLHNGMLVDELEVGSPNTESTLSPISLLELQAAIEAAAPPSPPPPLDDSPLSPLAHEESPPRELAAPLAASTPLAASAPSPAPLAPLAPASTLATRTRKRRSTDKIEDIFDGDVTITLSHELMERLGRVQEFSIDATWISNVVRKRKIYILSERKRLIAELDDVGELEENQPPDKGFCGFSGAEAADAAAARAALGARATRCDSDADDDDGFYERSSADSCALSSALSSASTATSGLGSEPDTCAADISAPDACASDTCAPAALLANLKLPGEENMSPEEKRRREELQAWKESILNRAAVAEARGTFDVHELGARVLGALRPRAARPVSALLRDHATEEHDVSRLVLATLFLANAGNVEIEQGPALSLNSYSLRLLSGDMRRLRLVAPER